MSWAASRRSFSATATPTTAAPRPSMGVPVHCHPDEVADAEDEAAIDSYMEISTLPALRARLAYPLLMRRWDGGPVQIDGTVSEGDRIAGFEVVEFPGHAHGLIGLWRESDRVALVSDVIYLIDSVKLGKPLPPGEASVPHPGLGLGPREGEAVGPQAGGSRPRRRRRRPRRAARGRQPARDAGTRGREVLSR